MNVKVVIVLLILLSGLGLGQVGVNVSVPQSTLDIRGANHQGANTATDGILIPRVASLGVNGTVNGQLIYLVADDATNGFSKGFHYWSGNQWQSLDTNTQDGDAWGVTGEDITSNIQRSGTVEVGGNGVGSVKLTQGNASNLGYISFHKPSGTRQGYIGWGDNELRYMVEAGGTHHFTGGNVGMEVDASTVASTDLKINQDVMIGRALGIGLEPDGTRFNFIGASRTGTYSHNAIWYATANIGAMSNGFEFAHSNGTAGIGLGWNGIYTFGTNGNNELLIRTQPGGYISLQPDNNSIAFIVNATSAYPSVDNQMGLGTSTRRYTSIFATSGVVQTSDIQFKKNIRPMKYGIKEVMKLNPVIYDWKDGTESDKVGFIAQELKEVVPNVVVGDESKEETLGVNYAELAPILTKAIQEQQKEIETLKALVNQLIEKIES